MKYLCFRAGVLPAIVLWVGLVFSVGTPPASAQQQPAPNQSANDAAPVDPQTLPGRLPDKAHVMTDVGYHFANLWFAADHQNWLLAQYYLDETRAHLQWAVRIKPVRKTKSGADVDLKAILEAVDNTLLAGIDKTIQNKDAAAFKTAYRETTVGCYACHTACEKPFLRVQVPESPGATIISFDTPAEAAEGDDASRGKTFFQQNCALCHATTLGPRNLVTTGQGPNLVGVVGRRAGTGLSFNYTQALVQSQIVWDAATLDHFLANPSAAVPGTAMPIPVPSADMRHNLIAFLSTLTAPAGPLRAAETMAAPVSDPGDWHHSAPGMKHVIDLAALPAPFATVSSGNGPRVVRRPADATLSVPPGFNVKLFADGLSGPRLVRLAPNGDIFIAETRENDIRVMRAADGADAPSQNQVFAEDLDRPFGIAFYPAGDNPKWIYVANNNSVVRFPYHNGDLAVTGSPEIIVPKLTDSHGGHSTRDAAFSQDGKRLFITVGSGSNIAEGMSRKTIEAIRSWEAEHAAARHGTPNIIARTFFSPIPMATIPCALLPPEFAMVLPSWSIQKPVNCGPPPTNATAWAITWCRIMSRG